MKHNRLKKIMQDSKNTASYESRDSIRRKNKVNQIIGNVAAGLAGDDEDAEADLTNKAAIEKIVDKYYQPEELPGADALTEMMAGWENPKCKLAVVGAAALLVGLYLYCR